MLEFSYSIDTMAGMAMLSASASPNLSVQSKGNAVRVAMMKGKDL